MQIAEHLVATILGAAGTGTFAGEVRVDQRLGFDIFPFEQQAADFRQILCRRPAGRHPGANRTRSELSLSTIRSSFTPPNIIAPSRPFPIGDDSVKFFAGASNQIVVSEGSD